MPALFASLALMAIQGPALVVPGDPALRPTCGAYVAPPMELIVAAPGEPDRPLATLERSRVPATEQGVPVCISVQRYVRRESTDLDSSVVESATLAPVRYSALVGASREEFWFRGDSAVGTVADGEAAPRRYAEQAAGPFFLAVADVEVLQALPLALGYEARFPSYNPGRDFHDVQIRVEALDTLTTLGRTVAAWRVSYDAGAAPTVMWFRQTDHEFVRSRSTLRNGTVFWRRRVGDGG